MFINCPNCRRLLALDGDGKPPTLCRYCHAPVAASDSTQDERMISVDPAKLTASTPATPGAATAPPATTPSAPPRSLATLLQPASENAPPAPVRLPTAAPGPNASHPPGSRPAARAPEHADIASNRPPPAAHAGTAHAQAPQARPPELRTQSDTPLPAAVDNPRPSANSTGAQRASDPAAAPAGPSGSPSKPTAGAATRISGSRPAMPSFARHSSAQASPEAQHRQRLLMVGVVALATLLVLQLLLAQRAQLATHAGWRPLLVSMCTVLRCSLPPWREPDAFSVVERDIRALNAPAGVLQVTARIRNDARWAQAWPQLQLTLSDVDGNPLATRIFQPNEYLGAAPTQPELASGADAAIRMQVLEPGPQAVAFTFDFH